MKKLIYLFSVVVLASCSSNKYAAHFTHYDRHENFASNTSHSTSVAAIKPELLTASLDNRPLLMESAAPQTNVEKKTFASMNKQERKAVKSQLRKEIKKYVKLNPHAASKVTKATSGSIDHDLKLAAIFGAVGVVALIIGTNAFSIIGGIALIIGVVFFIKWLIRQ